MPNRNPFEETLRAGREPTVPEFSRDTLPRGGWTPDLGDIFRQRGPIDSGDYFQQGPTPVDVPMQGEMSRRPVTSFQDFVNRGGGGNQYNDPFNPPGWPPGYDPFNNQIYTDPFDPRRLGLPEEEFDPFDPDNLGMGSGEYLAGMYGGGLDDVAAMNGDAMGMLEGAGFDVAGKSTDDRVVEKLWGRAVNSLPIGTSNELIEQEWERLKQIYYEGKYGGRGTTSSALPIGPIG